MICSKHAMAPFPSAPGTQSRLAHFVLAWGIGGGETQQNGHNRPVAYLEQSGIRVLEHLPNGAVRLWQNT